MRSKVFPIVVAFLIGALVVRLTKKVWSIEKGGTVSVVTSTGETCAVRVEYWEGAVWYDFPSQGSGGGIIRCGEVVQFFDHVAVACECRGFVRENRDGGS
jgi:hypothetical protein